MQGYGFAEFSLPADAERAKATLEKLFRDAQLAMPFKRKGGAGGPAAGGVAPSAGVPAAPAAMGAAKVGEV